MRCWRRGCIVLLLTGQALAVSRSPPPETTERLTLYPAGTHVLIIGESAYRDPSWPSLNGGRDAQRIQQLFLERGVPASAIQVALPTPGSKPSLEEIVIRFGEQLPAAASADSRVVVYIASHGYTADGIGYLVPPDAPDPRAASVAFKLAALPVTTLVARISAFRASHIMLILDSCFSGLALESLPRERFFHPPKGPDSQKRVMQVITAGSSGQTVADDGQFAELVVSGLVGAADLNLDGWISGTELGMYLRLRMTEISGGRQTPSFGNIVLGSELSEGENWFASAQLPLQSLARPSLTPERPTFRDCDDCPVLRVVPAQGDSAGSGYSYLALGIHEISFDEYDACFRAGGCTHWAWSPTGSRGAYPVTDVSRDDATQYARWLSCLTNAKYRLPSDAEWMAVAEPEAKRLARSLGSRIAIANCQGCGTRSLEPAALPVGSFSPSELGLYDLIGNVWEWVADCGDSDAQCRYGLVRGGAFTTRVSVAGSLPSGRVAPYQRDRNIGFRVARELDGAAPSALGLCGASQLP
jgi:Sulfatase-modifying factor enzyme 1